MRLALGNSRTNASITPGSCDRAPDAVRAAMARLSTFDCETGLSLEPVAVEDLGELDDDASRWVRALTECAAGLVLGGDNLATRAAVHALAEVAGGLEWVGLLTLDAHLDVRSTDAGLHNGNVVRALVEDGLPGRNIAQLGLAPFANSRDYWDYAQGVGSTLVALDELRQAGAGEAVRRELSRLAGQGCLVHVDFDMDVLDRAFAPACPGSRPGGLGPHELRQAVRAAAAEPAVRSADIVEIDPDKDEGGRTALAGAQVLATFACGLQARP